VRVRLTRIEGADLNKFKFDYDLTFMVFFLDSQGRVVSRYGGRDARDADNRQSLAGLAHVMREVARQCSSEPGRVIPEPGGPAKLAEQLRGGGGRGCMHCHQVQEAINRNLARDFEWDPESPWRYPLPENIGVRLHVDKGNLVEKVVPGSPAARAGIAPGDQIRQVGGVPVLSFGDMQQGLEEGPREGLLRVVYRRGANDTEAALTLPPKWKKTDITWRTSLRGLVPAPPVAGRNLTDAEKAAIGLSAGALAFRQRDTLTQAAIDAGIKPGDIVTGAEGAPAGLDSYGFQEWVRRDFLVGDTVRISLVRDGGKMVLPVVLGRR